MKYKMNSIKKSKYFIVKKKPTLIELYDNYYYFDTALDFLFDLCTIGAIGYIVYNFFSSR
jgi:hypothetical protein